MNTALNVPDTGCSCGCGEPADGGCAATQSVLWRNAGCGGQNTGVPVNACFYFDSNWVVGAVRTGTTSMTTAGSCVAEVTGSPSAPKWTKAVDMCFTSSSGGGCDPGFVCVPKPPAGLESSPCVQQPGSVPCPGAYPDQKTYFQGFSDDRTCDLSACTCGPASGEVCEAYLALYENNSCTGSAKGLYPLDGTCQNTGFGAYAVSSGAIVGSITGGSCPSSGTGIAGQVQRTDPQTVCCVAP
jgi:hypothetical protein